MNGIQEMLTLQGTLFALVLVGALSKKFGLISSEGKKTLTDLLITVILPCNIVNSFRIEFTFDILKKCTIVLVIAILIQLFCLLLSNTCFGKASESHKNVLQYATVCSNAGFMGNPMAETLYGGMGLLFASFYLIPLRFAMWSAGLSYFTHESNWKKTLKRVALHPCVIAVYIGMVIMVSGMTLPEVLTKPIQNISSCCTTVSMFIIGTIFAEIKGKDFLSVEVFLYSLLRLVVIPGCVLIAARIGNLDPLVTGVSVLLAGMPAGSTTAILAAKYGGDEQFATKCIVVSTLLSFITIPAFYVLMQ